MQYQHHTWLIFHSPFSLNCCVALNMLLDIWLYRQFFSYLFFFPFSKCNSRNLEWTEEKKVMLKKCFNDFVININWATTYIYSENGRAWLWNHQIISENFLAYPHDKCTHFTHLLQAYSES